MNDLQNVLLSIGRFSQATRLSIKALRLYERLSILLPAFVDQENGYRYYLPDQLPQARRIRLMRQMEMPLAVIRDVLSAAANDPERAVGLVQSHLEVRADQLEQARRLVPDLIKNLRKENDAVYANLEVKDVESQRVISITSRVKVQNLDSYIRSSVKRLREIASEQGVLAGGAPFGIYHGPVNPSEDGPMEVCLPLAGEVKPPEGVEFKQLQGGKAVSVMMEGSQCDFPAILKGYDAAYDWIRANGYKESGAPLEVWLSKPGEQDRMEILWLFNEA